MTRINLLPWRETRRRQRQKQFNGLALAAGLVALAGVFGACLWIDLRIGSQENRHRELQHEIERLEQLAGEVQNMDDAKGRLLAELEAVQELRANRTRMIRILDFIPRSLPEDLFLASLEATEPRVIIKGVAGSNFAVSQLLRNLANAPWLGGSSLAIIESRDIDAPRARAFEVAIDRKRRAPAASGNAMR